MGGAGKRKALCDVIGSDINDEIGIDSWGLGCVGRGG